MSFSSCVVLPPPVSVPVPIVLVTSSSFSSSSVSAVLAVCIEMSGDLDTSNTVHSGGLGEVVGRLVTHGVESFSYHTICQNPSELVVRIPHPWECYYLTNLEPSVHVVFPP